MSLDLGLTPRHTDWLTVSCNVTLTLTLTFNMTLGCITLFMGDVGEGALHWENEVTTKQGNKNLDGAQHQDELADKPSVAM
jgi:hypothetical protein